MKICYFGDYDPSYSRNKIIIQGLKENGVDVLECRVNKVDNNVAKLIGLYKKHKAIKKNYDIMIVGYSDSRCIVPFAKIISSKKIVWDAFYSLYDSWVFDRGLASRDGLKAKYYWWLDWINCKLSNTILLDTNEHIKYFINTFGIKKEKFLRILVGSLANTVDLNNKKQSRDNRFKVFFYGNYIPLQGAEYIIEAAKLLKNEIDIKFELVGTGQTFNTTKKTADNFDLDNIKFINKVPYKDLIERMSTADICLGIFGDTEKTQRVIPNKVYDSISLGKPVITANTLAIKELFTDNKNIVLCRFADGDDLARKIMDLKNDVQLRESVADGAARLFREKCLPKEVVKNSLNKLS